MPAAWACYKFGAFRPEVAQRIRSNMLRSTKFVRGGHNRVEVATPSPELQRGSTSCKVIDEGLLITKETFDLRK